MRGIYHAGDPVGFLRGRRPAAVSQIKERLRVTPSAVANLLRVLKNKGLVYRRADAGNRRKNLVFLTGEGERVFREERALVDGFSVGIRRRSIKKIKRESFRSGRLSLFLEM